MNIKISFDCLSDAKDFVNDLDDGSIGRLGQAIAESCRNEHHLAIRIAMGIRKNRELLKCLLVILENEAAGSYQ